VPAGSGRAPLVPVPALLLVVAGGTAGTAVRHLLEAAAGPGPGDWPWTTLGINVAGSFLLGALTAVLAGVPGDARRRRLRWALGTGVLGGFTTYSTFALEVHHLVLDGHPARAAGYAVVATAAGVLAAAAGLAAGSRAGAARGPST
jgi:CrcB protein